jgi:hypothetical protein
MRHLKKSKIMRTFVGTALFGAMAFGLAACPDEEPVVEDDPVVDEQPADEEDPFEDDTEDDDLFDDDDEDDDV